MCGDRTLRVHCFIAYNTLITGHIPEIPADAVILRARLTVSEGIIRRV